MEWIVVIGTSVVTSYSVVQVQGENEYIAQIREKAINPMVFTDSNTAHAVAKHLGGMAVKVGDKTHDR